MLTTIAKFRNVKDVEGKDEEFLEILDKNER